MQNKIQIPKYGFAVIYKKNALQFVLRWLRKKKSKIRVHHDWIFPIEFAAACPVYWREYWKRQLVDCYTQEPDLTAALLNCLRVKWSKLETSKAGRLKRFLSQNPAVPWQQGINVKADKVGNVPIWVMQDGEIAIAFEKSPGGASVTIDDVVKARKWVVANQSDGEKFAEKVLDKDGFLHVKGNLTAANSGGNIAADCFLLK